MNLSKPFLLFCLAFLTMFSIGCAATSIKETLEEHPDDTSLEVRVQTAIAREPSLRFSEITIETSRGVVHLHGVVISVLDRITAVEAARKVSGVIGVRNDMTVQGQP
ncbi:MAG: BON domain-containing protein [Humidesulfovibrio sp.]|nr:BON domain-containing protein [Humidesulfovibrio sp.]